ncbi:GAF domain-containing sensor histidine kinase [Brasilonema sp. UFV-L1]|uniref:GAF domain-containing sensor histidine kinase n=1 Tax=Brasilonema sp. UFV-L1 TaxID=2234130 RepID=UPI002006DD07|nr:GAF domain-containing sensor histidine kinase [Brasilonema sp. UFV-L1]
MNKFLSPSKHLDEADLQKQYSVKLMQHPEEPVYQLIQEINKIIANSSTPTRMLQDVAKVLGVAFKVDGCSLVTVSGEVSSETIIANWCARDHSELSGGDEIFPIEQHLDVAVMECASETLSIEDVSTIQKSLAIGHQSLPLTIKAVLAISTRFGSKNNGVISLIKSQPYIWRESEKQLLKAVESCCAIAFSQVAQAQQIAAQNQYLRTSVQHQSLIKQLTIISRSNLELNQMLQLALTSTAEALETDRGLLILLKYTDPLFRNRPKKQILKAKASVVGEWNKKTENFLINQSETSFFISDCGLCQRAFLNSGKPLIINDINDDTDLKDTLTVAPVFAIEALPAVLLMPLEIQGKVLGFLVLQQSVARNWQSAELNIVQMVCAQLSNTIIQTQTLRQVQTLVDERTAQLQRSLEVQARLYEIKRQQTEQLQRLNDLKDEFLSNISDRLRHPLTRIRLAIRNLRQMGQLNERQTKYAHMIEQDCTDEINLINDLLKLQALATHNERPQLETTDINARIRDLATIFDTKLAEKGIRLSLNLPDSPLTVQTEAESFDRILQELLTNASKYSEHDTVVHLEVTHQLNQQLDQVIIKVSNIGRGISQEEATYIFDRFRRGQGRWTPGAGVGLALVKSLVQHLNGSIAVESMPIEDSSLCTICFTLTLPQFSDQDD